MANRFWVGGSGTWDLSDTTHWSATSGGAGGQSVPGAVDNVTFDGNSGASAVVTVNANVIGNAITGGAFNGTLDFATNNNSPTFGGFNFSGTATRTLNMGSGTWTINGSGSSWNITTLTGLTFNAGTSTLVFSGAPTGTRQIQLGVLTYNNITITADSLNAHAVDFTNGGAFTVSGNLTITNCRNVRFSPSTTHTITGTFTYNGSSNTPALIYGSGGVTTLSVGAANSWDWVVAQNITKSGAGSIAITNGYDGGGLTNITVTNPSGGSAGARIIGG